MAKEIELTKGYKAIVDDEDFEKVNCFKWHVVARDNGLNYARRVAFSFPRKNGKQKQTYQFLHRLVLGITDKNILVDFKDDNPLNCQKKNLMRSNSACKTHYATPRNRDIENKGVKKQKGRTRWSAQIKEKNNKSKFLGSFDTKEEAKIAYDKALKKMMLEKGVKNI